MLSSILHSIDTAGCSHDFSVGSLCKIFLIPLGHIIVGLHATFDDIFSNTSILDEDGSQFHCPVSGFFQVELHLMLQILIKILYFTDCICWIVYNNYLFECYQLLCDLLVAPIQR